MAFDPDEFIKNSQPSTTATEISPDAEAFDPDKFIQKNPVVTTGAEPAMVADIQLGPSQPGMPMVPPPETSAVPQVPITAYGPGVMDAAKSAITSTQLGANASKIMQPYVTGGTRLMGQYTANPLTKLAPDLVAVASGVPPPFATAQAIGATQGAYNVARTLPPAPGPVPADPLLNTEMGREMARRAAAAEAETLANRSMIQKIAMNKLVQNTMGVVAPVLNTAARIAGPAGLALNTYEAGQMARNTQLGERLAQGQGKSAETAFRQMIPQTSTKSGSWTDSITPDQARAALANGSARDIQALGGSEFLRKRALGQL